MRIANAAASRNIEKPNPEMNDDRARQDADAAEDRRDERLNARHEPHQRVDGVVVDADEDACDRRERRADGERDGDDAVGVDAHELCRFGVVGRGAHRLADLRRAHDVGQDDHKDKGHAHDEELLPVDDEPFECPRDVADRCGERARRRRDERHHDVLEQERHADRRDEHRDARRVAQRAVREPLDRDTEQGGHRHGDEDRGHDGDAERDGIESEVRADHVDVAVREVDELDDAVDHRIAERDERVDAAEGYSVNQLLENLLHELHRTASCGLCY